jgi:diguanylate cyclase (GGDEF)-like protein
MVAATALGLAINIGRRSTIEHSADAVRQAERVATEDPLTGLLNRRGLALLGREIVGVAQRTGEATHATFLDIDGLKGINDALGHDVGDNIILSVAEAARASVRGTDIVARWGGDQFVIVGLGAGTSLEEMHSRLRSYFEDTFPLDIVLQGVSLSSGRAVLAPWDLGDLSSLVEKADLDLYERREARGQRSLVDFQPGDPQFRLEP